MEEIGPRRLSQFVSVAAGHAAELEATDETAPSTRDGRVWFTCGG